MARHIRAGDQPDREYLGLRKALEDGRDGTRIIQTVPGSGYRFVAPVVACDAVGDALTRAEPASTAEATPDLQRAPHGMSACPLPRRRTTSR